jgi:mono/diheme cytochrome c family protein
MMFSLFTFPRLCKPYRSLAAFCLAMLCSAPSMANPRSTDDGSVARGAQLFQQFCTQCHGRDGRAQVDVISDATDLTDPEAYYSGSSEQEIFNSIANGAGVAMPAWRTQLGTDDAIWDVVNFILSLQGE